MYCVNSVTGIRDICIPSSALLLLVTHFRDLVPEWDVSVEDEIVEVLEYQMPKPVVVPSVSVPVY